jgi:predicted nucleic acid-binding protein
MAISKVIFDSKVLFSALYSRLGVPPELLGRVGQPSFELQSSTPLVAEYEAVLQRRGLQLSPQQIDAVIDPLCAHGGRHEIFYLWRPILKDPDDDFLLELAIKAQAGIVTWNLADFRKAGQFGVATLTPRQWLQQPKDTP